MKKHPKPLTRSQRARLERLRRTRKSVDAAVRKLASDTKAAALALSAEGLSTRDVAFLVGTSHQRVHQWLKEQEMPF